MIAIYAVLYIIVVHLVADFFMQTKYMAENKSKNWWALSSHVLVYSWATSMLWILKFDVFQVQYIFGITFICHFITDAVTSRITAWLWSRKHVRLFWVIIGMDQTAHYTQLFLMYLFLS